MDNVITLKNDSLSSAYDGWLKNVAVKSALPQVKDVITSHITSVFKKIEDTVAVKEQGDLMLEYLRSVLRVLDCIEFKEEVLQRISTGKEVRCFGPKIVTDLAKFRAIVEGTVLSARVTNGPVEDIMNGLYSHLNQKEG